MKTTILAVTCALCAAACANNKPAQDQSNAVGETQPPSSESATTSGTMGTQPGATGNPTGSTSMMGNGTTEPGTTNEQGATNEQGTTNEQGATNQGTTTPDNTATTTRSATATPQQGTTKAELAITATIHRDVMRDKTLSATAKSVKVITSGTTVTLRGPVKSDTERTTIENLARQTPGVTDVDNQLEVKGAK